MGCTLTCISMLSSYFDDFKAPSELTKHFDLFNADSKVIWAMVRKYVTKMRHVYRYYRRDDAVIMDALKDKNKAIMFEVNNGSHWVVGVRPTVFGNSYMGIDPWDGSMIDVIKKYKNISGMSVFARV